MGLLSPSPHVYFHAHLHAESMFCSFQSKFAVRNHDQTCQFPAWMTSEHRQYHNLTRPLPYHFNKAGTSLTGEAAKPIISTLSNL